MQQINHQCPQTNHENQFIIGGCINQECQAPREFCWKCSRQFHSSHQNDLIDYDELNTWGQNIQESSLIWNELQKVFKQFDKKIIKKFLHFATPIPNDDFKELNTTQFKSTILAFIVISKANHLFSQRINEILTLLSQLEQDCLNFYEQEITRNQQQQQVLQNLLELSPIRSFNISTGVTQISQMIIPRTIAYVEENFQIFDNSISERENERLSEGANSQKIDRKQSQTDQFNDSEGSIEIVRNEQFQTHRTHNQTITAQMFYSGSLQLRIQFSSDCKFQSIQLKEFKEASNDSNKKGIILCDSKVPDYKCYFSFRAKQITYIYLGIAPKQVSSSQYQMPEQLKLLGQYGFHLMSDYGFSFSPNEQDNCIQQQFRFDKNQLISVNVDLKGRRIKWINHNSQQQFGMKIKKGGNQFYPFVGLSSGSSIEIIEDLEEHFRS